MRALALCLALTIAGCSFVNPHHDPAKAHHRPDGFVNPDGGKGGKPLADLLRWWRERARDDLPRPPAQPGGYAGFPSVQPDLALLAANRTRTTVTWISHATLLVQIGGLNVLTDPHFSERASPVSFAGPKRRVPLPVRLDELPRIDVVLVSHSHYDHLDLPTVRALAAQAGGPPLFLVPLGIDDWMRRNGIAGARALDWWDRIAVPGAPGLEAHFVPAHHWSSRTPWDRNRTLWGGWVLKTPSFSFWFAGDTGASPVFAEIGRRFGGFDFAAVPVGAYEPRWFMREQHVNPEEAVELVRVTNTRRAVGIHWGSFELTDESLDAPPAELARARAAAGMAVERLETWKHGEMRVLD